MRGPVKIINRKNDLKKGYLIRLEIGFIVALLILISAFKMDLNPSEKDDTIIVDRQEEVFMEEIVQTKQEMRAPPPPRPVVPIEVPNDEIIEDEMIDLDAELDFDAPLEIPPPPQETKHENSASEEDFFIVVEQMPVLIGGLAELQRNVIYPDMARKAGIEGRVIIQFVVNEKGMVVDPEVIRGIGGGCDEAALQAVRTVQFEPGMQRGVAVSVRYTVPITFKLQDDTVAGI